MAPVERRLRELVPDERLRVLENTRFDPGETKNDEGYARELADGNDLYVNDAFGSAHRAHSSTEAVAHLLPAYAGLLLLAELEHLGRLLGDVERPFVLDRRRREGRRQARRAREPRRARRPRPHRRQDGRAAARAQPALVPGRAARSTSSPRARSPRTPRRSVAAVDAIPDGWLGLDIGPATAEAFGAIVREARTIFWNGPMGVFEWSRFAAGTSAVAEAVAAADAYSVVGGGDSVSRDPGARPRRPRLVGVDRRRRVARAARGPGASRRRRDPGGLR